MQVGVQAGLQPWLHPLTYCGSWCFIACPLHGTGPGAAALLRRAQRITRPPHAARLKGHGAVAGHGAEAGACQCVRLGMVPRQRYNSSFLSNFAAGKHTRTCIALQVAAATPPPRCAQALEQREQLLRLLHPSTNLNQFFDPSTLVQRRNCVATLASLAATALREALLQQIQQQQQVRTGLHDTPHNGQFCYSDAVVAAAAAAAAGWRRSMQWFAGVQGQMCTRLRHDTNADRARLGAHAHVFYVRVHNTQGLGYIYWAHACTRLRA
eukprot:1158198-Pelagomonas_calceolata.AAC.7